jgi:hypothetical protein
MGNIGNLSATMTLDNARFLSALTGTHNAMNAASARLSSLVASAAAFAGVSLSVGGAVMGMKAAVDKAAQMEDLETSFDTLLGGMSRAKERMAELSKFAAETPFELPEVASASMALETMTRGALSTGNGLRMVGDAAAISRRGFGEMADIVGRLYSGLQMGAGWDDPLRVLTSIGAITPDTTKKIKEMVKSGAAFGDVWKVVEGDFSRVAGAMEKRSKTYTGLMSTLADSWSALQRAFGEPIRDAFKPLIANVTTWLDSMGKKAAELGKTVANALNVGIAAFKAGELGKLLEVSLKLAAMEGVNALATGLGSAVQVFAAGLAGALAAASQVLADKNFWKGLIQSAGALEGYFMASVSKAANWAVLRMDEASGTPDASLRKKMEMVEGAWTKAGDNLAREGIANAGRSVVEGARTGIKGATSEFEKSGGFKPVEIFPQEQLDRLGASLQALIKALAPQAAPDLSGDGGKKKGGGEETGKPTKATVAPKIEADRLAKIGGFIGGSSPAGLDYARRTADNTSKIEEREKENKEVMDEINAGLREALDYLAGLDRQDGLT